MSFVVVCDHDRISHSLSDNLSGMILDGEDDSKSEFLILMSTVACNSHRQLYLHGAWRKRLSSFRGAWNWAVLHWFCPLLNLICVEYNHTFLLIFLKQLFLVWFLLLFTRGSFPFPLDAPRTYANFAAIQRFLFIILGRLRTCRR